MALIGTLTSGVSALRTFSKGLEVIGNNIANINTTAYKSSQVSFSDAFSNTLRSSSSGVGESALQIGSGVQLAGISTNFTQSALNATGNGTDLGISGRGYFVVQDQNGTNYATRDGAFHFDSDGFLRNVQGFQVLGDDGAAIQVPTFSDVKSLSIASDGTINAFDAAGLPITVTNKVGLLNISDETKLLKRGGSLYDFSTTGALITGIGTAGSDSLGKIEAGTLEASNVDLTEQFSQLITTQRSFQAGSRLITVSDSVLEDVVNLKRS